MAKLNIIPAQRDPRSPLTTTATRAGAGHEQLLYERDPKTELVLLAITNMVGEPTFYEPPADRDQRYRNLIRRLALSDPPWLLEFLRWLRLGANMRTAALVGAVEAAAAVRAAGPRPAYPRAGVRRLIDAVCQRADEPTEILAGWLHTYGRPIPTAVKRGLADAMVRLYTERNMLNYDGKDKPVRWGDAVDLVCPATHRPDITAAQFQLFGYAIDRRHGFGADIPPALTVLHRNAALRAAAVDDPTLLADAAAVRAAGMTWKDTLAAAGTRVPKNRLWETVIPSMGVTALLRNLRNFDQAGIDDTAAQQAAAKLRSAAHVTAARLMPLQVLAAFRTAPSPRWQPVLEETLQLTLTNVPALAGRTLILIDVSGSMAGTLSSRSVLNRADAAAVFACAVAQRCTNPTLAWYNHGGHKLPVHPGETLLAMIGRVPKPAGGTHTAAALGHFYAGHDQVLVFTDEQVTGREYTFGDVTHTIPTNVPMITWNLGGYQYGHAPSGNGGRYVLGGLTDNMFTSLPYLLAGTDTTWPWQHQPATRSS